MKKLLLMTLMLVIAVMASAKNIQTVIFTTHPQMHCESCENKIKGNLRFAKGVKKIETSVEDQKVTITYDADKTTVEKLQKEFQKIGYQVRVTTAEEKIAKEAEDECENM